MAGLWADLIIEVKNANASSSDTKNIPLDAKIVSFIHFNRPLLAFLVVVMSGPTVALWPQAADPGCVFLFWGVKIVSRESLNPPLWDPAALKHVQAFPTIGLCENIYNITEVKI